MTPFNRLQSTTTKNEPKLYTQNATSNKWYVYAIMLTRNSQLNDKNRRCDAQLISIFICKGFIDGVHNAQHTVQIILCYLKIGMCG